MQHIGYCAIYGFRIDIPYLVQDMVDMAHNLYPPNKSEVTLPASVNAQFMQANDNDILSFTSQESYWWQEPKTIRHARVDDETIKTQFTEFFHAVINNVVPEDSDIRQYMTIDRVDVPGLAERPPNPLPLIRPVRAFLIVQTARISPNLAPQSNMCMPICFTSSAE